MAEFLCIVPTDGRSLAEPRRHFQLRGPIVKPFIAVDSRTRRSEPGTTRAFRNTRRIDRAKTARTDRRRPLKTRRREPPIHPPGVPLHESHRCVNRPCPALRVPRPGAAHASRLRNRRPAEGRPNPPRALHGRACGALKGESPCPPGTAGAQLRAPDRGAAGPPGAGLRGARRAAPRRCRSTRPVPRDDPACRPAEPPRRPEIQSRRADLQGRTRRGAARFRRLGAADLAPICGKTATPCGRRPRRSGPDRSGGNLRRSHAAPAARFRHAQSGRNGSSGGDARVTPAGRSRQLQDFFIFCSFFVDFACAVAISARKPTKMGE